MTNLGIVLSECDKDMLALFYSEAVLDSRDFRPLFWVLRFLGDAVRRTRFGPTHCDVLDLSRLFRFCGVGSPYECGEISK